MGGNRNEINIQVSSSLLIRGSPEEVWDFTQDPSQRTAWDPSCLECTLLPGPEHRVFFRSRFLCAVMHYKAFNRPHKTSLRLDDVASYVVSGGGGSWVYERQADGATLWTQSNALVLRHTFLAMMFHPLIRIGLSRNTRSSMQRAKRILERTINV